MITTKGRYALRMLIDMSEHLDEVPVRLKDIAARQEISEKYLQQVAKTLVDGGLLTGASGKGGGYRMTKPPEECTVAEVLAAAEGTLAPVACVACDVVECERSQDCKTLPLWKRFNNITYDFFGSVTIYDLVHGTVESVQ